MIVMVLVTLALAAFLLAAFIQRSGTELLADARAALHRELRAEAYSALETTLAVVAADRARLGVIHRPDPDWITAVAQAGYEPASGRELELIIEDESARISLPQAGLPVLEAALTDAGLGVSQAEEGAQLLMAWMQPAGGGRDAITPDYARHDPPYASAGRPLLDWGEFAALERGRGLFTDEEGRPAEAMRRLQRDFSLQRFARSNLCTASEAVLRIMGVGSGEISALVGRRAQLQAQRDMAGWRSLSDVVGPVGSARFDTTVSALRILVTVRQGSVAYRLRTIVSWEGAAAGARSQSGPATSGAAADERKRIDYPFAILELREDLEAPEPSDIEP